MRTLIAESPTPSPKRNVHPSGWVEPSEKIVLNRARGEGGNGGVMQKVQKLFQK